MNRIRRAPPLLDRAGGMRGNVWLPGDDGDLVSAHFAAGELRCRCGKCRGFINTTALRCLERVRLEIGQPFVITSAYRCPAHNAAVGGAPTSMHQLGCAFDVMWTGWPAELRSAMVNSARDHFAGGIGLYADWIHVDTGPARSWGAWSHVTGGA